MKSRFCTALGIAVITLVIISSPFSPTTTVADDDEVIIIKKSVIEKAKAIQHKIAVDIAKDAEEGRRYSVDQFGSTIDTLEQRLYPSPEEIGNRRMSNRLPEIFEITVALTLKDHFHFGGREYR